VHARNARTNLIKEHLTLYIWVHTYICYTFDGAYENEKDSMIGFTNEIYSAVVYSMVVQGNNCSERVPGEVKIATQVQLAQTCKKGT
jgi:hypothetical protein